MARLSILLAAALAISAPAAAQGPCDPAGGLAFVCGLTNAEDMVQVPGTPWIIASGLADGGQGGGHLYLVIAEVRWIRTLLPVHVAYGQD